MNKKQIDLFEKPPSVKTVSHDGSP